MQGKTEIKKEITTRDYWEAQFFVYDRIASLLPDEKDSEAV